MQHDKPGDTHADKGTPSDEDLLKDPEIAAIAAQQSGGAQSKEKPDGWQNADGADRLEGETEQPMVKPDGSR